MCKVALSDWKSQGDCIVKDIIAWTFLPCFSHEFPTWIKAMQKTETLRLETRPLVPLVPSLHRKGTRFWDFWDGERNESNRLFKFIKFMGQKLGQNTYQEFDKVPKVRCPWYNWCFQCSLQLIVGCTTKLIPFSFDRTAQTACLVKMENRHCHLSDLRA